MQRYFNYVQRTTANGLSVVPGARITVRKAGTSTNAALFSDNGVTTLFNPLTSESDGSFSFFAANGEYDLVFSATNVTFDADDTTKIRLWDPNDENIRVSEYADYDSALASATGATATLYVASPTSITTSRTVPATVTTVVDSPGYVTIGSGVFATLSGPTICRTATVTFVGGGNLGLTGPFSAPLRQVFGSSLTVSFGAAAIEVLHAVWMGYVADDSTDNATALQAAHDALPTAGGYIRLPTGTGQYGTTLSVSKPIVLEGSVSGPAFATILKYTAATGNGISCTPAADGFRIQNLKLFSSNTTTGTGIDCGTVGSSLREPRIQHVEIEDFLIGIELRNPINAVIDQVRILGQGKAVAGGIGIKLDTASFTDIFHAYIQTIATGVQILSGTPTTIIGGAIETATTGVDAQSYTTIIGTRFDLFGGSASSEFAVKETGGAAVNLYDIHVFNAASSRQENWEDFISYSSGGRTRSRFVMQVRDYPVPGSAIAAGNFALSAGWGSTSSISAASGRDRRGTFTVTSAGTGQGANPTITYTFVNGAHIDAPHAIVTRNGGDQTDVAQDWTTTTTTLVITWRGTPVAAETFTFEYLINP